MLKGLFVHFASNGITTSKALRVLAKGSASNEQTKIIFALIKCLRKDSIAGRIIRISPMQ